MLLVARRPPALLLADTLHRQKQFHLARRRSQVVVDPDSAAENIISTRKSIVSLDKNTFIIIFFQNAFQYLATLVPRI